MGILAGDVWDGGEEFFGIVVFWGVKDGFCISVFDNFSLVHDCDVIGKVADDGEIM